MFALFTILWSIALGVILILSFAARVRLIVRGASLHIAFYWGPIRMGYHHRRVENLLELLRELGSLPIPNTGVARARAMWPESEDLVAGFPEILPASAKLILRLVKGLRFHRMRISLAGGVGDPAVTGMLYGIHCALQGSSPRYNFLRFAPDYLSESLDVRLALDVRVRPGQLLWALAVFVYNARLFGALCRLFKNRRNRRNVIAKEVAYV